MPFRPQSITAPKSQWLKPLAFTLALHFFLLLFGFLAPRLINFQKKIPEVYTVNLFSVEDLGAPSPAASGQPAPLEAEAAPKQVKTLDDKAQTNKAPEKLSAKVKPEPALPPAPKDAVSLKPIKTKEKSDIEKLKKLQEKILTENAEKQNKAAAEKAEKARADAEQKAKTAVSSLMQAIKAGQQAANTGKNPAGQAAAGPPQGGSGTGTGSGGGGISVDENLRRYLLAVNNQIQEHWVLPDTQNWKATVEAIVIIRVKRDGTIAESSFKKRSDNVFFNQFVEKTLKLSSPLPPFPIGLNQPEMEIGLKFRPGEVF